LQVGSDAGGGLSFEQKKRLSIAVEVAANPSVLFLVSPRSLRLQQALYALEVNNQSLTPFSSTVYFVIQDEPTSGLVSLEVCGYNRHSLRSKVNKQSLTSFLFPRVYVFRMLAPPRS
jgi:hypothetical protein